MVVSLALAVVVSLAQAVIGCWGALEFPGTILLARSICKSFYSLSAGSERISFGIPESSSGVGTRSPTWTIAVS